MEKIVPQKDLFETSLKIKKLNGILYIIGLALMVLSTIFFIQLRTSMYKIIVDIIVLLTAVGIAVTSYVFEHYKEKADNIRRDGLLNNAFGKNYSNVTSKNYYDNDEIADGLRKLLANVHENNLFTYKITEQMLTQQLPFLIVLAVVIIICGYIGFANAFFAQLVLEFFLSDIAIGQYIRLKRLNWCSETILKEIGMMLAQSEQNKTPTNKLLPDVIHKLLIYETSISQFRGILSNKLYKKMNDDLTKEWNTLKEKYSIYSISNEK